MWSIILISIDHTDYCKTKKKESNSFLIISLQNKELKLKYLFSEDQLSSLIISNNLVSFIYSTKPLGLQCYSNEVFNEDLSLFHSDIVEFHFFFFFMSSVLLTVYFEIYLHYLSQIRQLLELTVSQFH